MSLRGSLVGIGLLASLAGAARAGDLLPDLVTVPDTLGDIRIDRDEIPGRTLLRLSNMTPNIGSGALEVRAGAVVGAESQLVNQRIYDSNGGYRDRPAGTFTYHESHHHVHFDGWAAYRLRTVEPDGSPGEVVAEGVKTSFCLFDLRIFDPANPQLPASPGVYRDCEFGVQGISPGWADIYDRELPDQWVDITELPPGDYWLEAEVDPDDRVLEEDETNNVARVRISTLPPPPALPDPYEDNDSFAQVSAREAGAIGSPNLAAIESRRVIGGLSLEDAADVFRFEIGQDGEPGSFVRIESRYLGNDLDLSLFTEGGAFVASSRSRGSFEQISLEGLPAGGYFARVFPGAANVQNPDYTLSIAVARNQAPVMKVGIAGSKLRWLERGVETLPVAWRVVDPDGDATRVSLAVARTAASDDGAIALGGYRDLAGESSGANVNTASLELGRWFLRASATDGAAITRVWAKADFTIYVKGDVNFDGRVDERDWQEFLRRKSLARPPPGWRAILDMDRDGRLRVRDFALFEEAVFGGDSGG